MKNKPYLLLAASLFSTLGQAAPLAQTPLPDGRLIQIEDDFT